MLAAYRLLWFTMVSCLVLEVAPVYSEAPPRSNDVWDGPTLQLLWNDGYDLFPQTAFAGMKREVESLFAKNGIRVDVHRAEPGQTLSEFPEPAVNVVVQPMEGESWGLGKHAMAAAVGERGGSYTIFVFYPAVERTLGLASRSRRLSPRNVADLARGMGRIVGHELVHVLAPERGHAEVGLMARQLTRRVLLGSNITIDPWSRRVARAAVADLVESVERVAEIEAGQEG